MTDSTSCAWNPAQTTTDCDWDRNCPVHGANPTVPAAVAAEGALPVPVGDQPQPLDEGLMPEPIPARWDRTVILPEHPNGDLDGQTIVCCIADDSTKRPIGLFLGSEHREALGLLLVDPNGEDEQHTALLAEVQRLNAELAKYVGAEPTIAEEMAYLSRSVEAVTKVCDQAERQARRWENPLPVPEWVGAIRQALELAPTTSPAPEEAK